MPTTNNPTLLPMRLAIEFSRVECLWLEAALERAAIGAGCKQQLQFSLLLQKLEAAIAAANSAI